MKLILYVLQFVAILSFGTFIIGLGRMELVLNELTTFSPFLRFDTVWLWSLCDEHSIKEKCEFIESHLRPLKSALVDSQMIEFRARISAYDDGIDFSDHLQLLEYIRNRLLPICNSSLGYKFYIDFESDFNSAANVIASLLQMPEIKRCANVEIKIIHWRGRQNQLPIETISTWLERSADVVENNVQKQRERSLTISTEGVFGNTREMLDHMKTVNVETHFKRSKFKRTY